MRLDSAAKLFSIYQPAWVRRSVFDWFKLHAGKLKLISEIQAGEYVEKKEQDSDMNLPQFQVDFKRTNPVSRPISLFDEVNIDPSDEFS